MNLGLFRSISALDQQPLPEPIGQIGLRWLQMGTIHQPDHQLMGGDGEIKISLGMTGKTKLTLQPLHQSVQRPHSSEVRRGVHRFRPPDAAPVVRPAPGSAGLRKILLATDATAVGSEQNQLGGI